jgi:uncharacterized membrane protein YeaQ/YmgE (transglycosylase-associated protein family)
MNLIVYIILGGIIGYLASKMLGRNEGILMSIIIGIIGSFLGGYVSQLFTGGDKSFLAFSWMGLFWSFVGSVILVAIINAVRGGQHHRI